MTYYRQVGEIPKKRHSVFRNEAGGLYAEELVGEEGFFNDSSLLYHRNLPNALVAAEACDVPALTACGVPHSPLLPHRFQTHDLSTGADDFVTGRRLMLVNDDVRVSYVVAGEASPLFRNARGDELVFVESGSATLESSYGRLTVEQGDYVVVPMGCIHRWVPGGGETRALVVEASGHFRVPQRYLSPRGQLLETAPYHERDLRGPDELLVVDEGETEVLVRHRDGVTRHVFKHHPFDVIGWDGCVYPYALSIHDFEPLVKRFHAPPPIHETFTGPGFVVCSFCPRPVDFDPTAIPAPYAHSAIDCDEMMFFVSGAYVTRPDVRPGMMTFHPAGFVHGPAPGAAEGSIGGTHHEEYAVMIDTFKPLSMGAAASDCEQVDYHLGWSRPAPAQS